MTERLFADLARCLHCKVPACKAACPLGNDLPEVVQRVLNEDYGGAVGIVGHPFGGVCGSVCPHELQCGGGCVLGKKSYPVPTWAAEAEAFSKSPYSIAVKDDKLRNVKVAVAGGGVSGITFAVKCYESGADVTVYEADKLLSTLYLIPGFRLPHKYSDDIVAAVNQSGIKVVHRRVEQSNLAQLRTEYDIVYLAVGQTVGRKLGIEGEQYATQAYDFLAEVDNAPKQIVVVGGGNTAMDCARLNVRRGGSSVVAYRRTLADMPCFAKELADAQADGVEFATNLAPVSAQKLPDGRLKVNFAKTVSEGRGKLTVTDELTTFVCDKLVAAVGNVTDFVSDKEKIVADNCGKISDGLYGGGDLVGGKLVVDAVKHALCAYRAVTE